MRGATPTTRLGVPACACPTSLALLVEPQQREADWLRGAAAKERLGSDIRVRGGAICANDSQVTFYEPHPLVGFTQAPSHLNPISPHAHTSPSVNFAQAASLSFEFVRNHTAWWLRRRAPAHLKQANASDLVVAKRLPCPGVSTLLREEGVEPRHVKVITIDAEGTDVAIAASLPLDRLSTLSLLMWEQRHVQGSDVPLQQQLVRRLTQHHGFACSPLKTAGRHACAGRFCDLDNVWCARALAGPPPCQTLADGLG